MRTVRLLIKRPLFLIGILLFLGFAAFLIIGSMPATGTIQDNLSAADIKHLSDTSGKTLSKENRLDAAYTEAQNEKQNKAASQTFDGQYFRLMYPAGYSVKEHDTGLATELEKLILVTNGSFSDHLTVTIDTASETSLTDIPSVSLRIKNPDTYQESQVAIDGTPGLEFTSTSDGYEKIAFALSGNTLLTIAYVTSGDTDRKDVLSGLISSFRWKK